MTYTIEQSQLRRLLIIYTNIEEAWELRDTNGRNESHYIRVIAALPNFIIAI